MQKMSKEKERKIIQELMEDTVFIDNGSSRAVFGYKNGTVVKIAMDDEGKAQNRTEIEMFEENGDYYLAEIFEYGEYIIIQEEVQPEDFEYIISVYNDCQSDEEFNKLISTDNVDEVTTDMVLSAIDTVSFLADNLGESTDIYQLGVRFGSWQVVAYDYGFDANSNEDNISNKLRDFIEKNADNYQTFLNYILERI